MSTSFEKKARNYAQNTKVTKQQSKIRKLFIYFDK